MALCGKVLILQALCASVLLAPLPAAASAPSVLVLDVTVNGRSEARLQRGLSEHLLRAGVHVQKAARLSVQERACSAADCLRVLAQREQSRALIGALVDEQRQQFGRSFAITVWLYDAARQQPLSRRTLCPDCLPEALGLRIAQTADALLADALSKGQNVASARRTAAAPPAAPPAPAPVQAQTPRAEAAPRRPLPPAPAPATGGIAARPQPSAH